MNDTWTIYTDGGSRGNPGPAAYAYVIKRPGEPDIEEMVYLGQSTNNIAEYTGMVKALEHAKELGGRNLIVNSDSELMVKQMNGQYRVKNEGLLPLYRQAVKLREAFEKVTFKHIYREQNAQADALCNEAMDNPHDSKPRIPLASSGSPGEGPAVRAVAAKDKSKPANESTPQQQAIALLRQSAEQWAKGDPTKPDPASVWMQLSLLMQKADSR